MSKVISKCVVIGGGRIALSHIPHLIDHLSVEVIGIVEPNLLLRLVLSRLFKVKVYRSLDTMRRVDFDSAFILTPPMTHYSLAKTLLGDGKHVFVEKPMTLDSLNSAELLTLAKGNNVQFSCGYVYRHHPIFKEIKRIVTDKVYGLPVSSEITMRGNVVTSDSPVSWRSVGKGSGCLFDYGCHVIDLSIFLFGKPESVTCLSKEELYQPGVIDRFSAKIDHSDFCGIQSHIICDWSDELARKAGMTIEIKTQDHCIQSDGQTITLSGATCASYSIKDLDTDVSFYLRGEEFQNQTDKFFMTIANGKMDYTDAEDAASVDEILSKIYEQVL